MKNDFAFFPEGEATYFVRLRVRSRIARAFRWPLYAWQFRKAGAPWRQVFRLTHWIIWYRPAAARGDQEA